MTARVNVSVVRLDPDAPSPAQAECLAGGDRYRAGSIADPSHRASFLAGRAALRRELGRWLECPPAQVPIRTDARGKPFVPGVEFSVSRSGPWFATAVSLACPVGVDVEEVRPWPGWEAVMAEFFPLPAASCEPGAFFHWWTRMEAAVKACGLGLDDAEKCLSLAPQQVFERLGGVVVAVAGRTAEGLDVVWSAPAVDVAVEPGPQVLAGRS